MAADSRLDPESESFNPIRPTFFIGQHDSKRRQTLTEAQQSQLLDAGFSFATTPITNGRFQARVEELYKAHIRQRAQWGQAGKLSAADLANASLPRVLVPTLTDDDTSLFPSTSLASLVAYSSPWIDLCSKDATISSISRQVLNIEVAYANFCGARSIIIPGPRGDTSEEVSGYARAIQEALQVAVRANLIIHLPMYREPGLEESAANLSSLIQSNGLPAQKIAEEIDLFSSWDTWHTIRSVCDYSSRLYVALRVPRRLPEKELQERWFAEPLHYLTFGARTFQENRSSHPTLSRQHQEMINSYMRLKNSPWMILHDVGPSFDLAVASDGHDSEFPSLAEAAAAPKENRKPAPAQLNDYVSYMRYLQRQQVPLSPLEAATLTNFQDWLQSPLQPLADNLESATYEMFEGDPVKYDLYEEAITAAMVEWKAMGKPTSARNSQDLVVAVAGAGRGPLVTRVLQSAKRTGTPIQLWALEKNQNAYVYLLRRNQQEWGGRVTLVQTDMRGWEGPKRVEDDDSLTKVDILVTELLGSFGDNELSPECIDGIQHHIARPYGISIPQSYTAHLSPIATPRLFADLRSRAVADPNAFETPWVVWLFAHTLVCQRTPDHGRFQQAWEFAHPVPRPAGSADHTRRTPGGGGSGSMAGSGGTNEHNARHCHLAFVCRSRGAIHGLAGYFEAVLYAPQSGDKEMVELSTLPDQIDRKSKDMISWFPIFFPLKQPLYFPPDSELEVTMWRQTDDKKVWYEWMVEAFMWIGPSTRVKVGTSEFHSSRKVACQM